MGEAVEALRLAEELAGRGWPLGRIRVATQCCRRRRGEDGEEEEVRGVAVLDELQESPLLEGFWDQWQKAHCQMDDSGKEEDCRESWPEFLRRKSREVHVPRRALTREARWVVYRCVNSPRFWGNGALLLAMIIAQKARKPLVVLNASGNASFSGDLKSRMKEFAVVLEERMPRSSAFDSMMECIREIGEKEIHAVVVDEDYQLGTGDSPHFSRLGFPIFSVENNLHWNLYHAQGNALSSIQVSKQFFSEDKLDELIEEVRRQISMEEYFLSNMSRVLVPANLEILKFEKLNRFDFTHVPDPVASGDCSLYSQSIIQRMCSRTGTLKDAAPASLVESMLHEVQIGLFSPYAVISELKEFVLANKCSAKLWNLTVLRLVIIREYQHLLRFRSR